MNKRQGIFLRADGAESGEAVIDIHGEIGWDIWADRLRDMIAGLGDNVQSVTFDIYSPGGSVWDGNYMINLIGDMKQETTAKVQVAASMATLIAVACDKCVMAANGRWLIHNPWTMAAGDHVEMEKNAKTLKEATDEAAEFYARRSGMDMLDVLKLMDEERWMRAPEAKEKGFIQEIVDPFQVEDFAEMSAEIAARGKWPVALVLDEAEGEAEPEGEEGNGDQAEENTEGDSVDAGEDGGGSADDDGQPAADPEPEEGEAGAISNPQDMADDDTGRVRLYDAIEASKAKIDELRAELVAARAERDAIEAAHKAEMAKAETLRANLEQRLARLLPAMADSSTDEPAPAQPKINDVWKARI